jgi:serine/threonine-protein kinase RsbT
MQMALDMGFLPADATKIAVVISELARNIISYAGEGTITIIGREEDSGARYVKVIADDKGPGIPDVEQALFDGYTTSGGLGLGLSGSKRLMDEFSVFSEVGTGTTVTAVKWLR